MERAGVGVEVNEVLAALIQSRIRELFEFPDWEDLDILHSSATTPSRRKPRRAHLLRGDGRRRERLGAVLVD
jgi:hypothetical protein